METKFLLRGNHLLPLVLHYPSVDIVCVCLFWMYSNQPRYNNQCVDTRICFSYFSRDFHNKHDYSTNSELSWENGFFYSLSINSNFVTCV